MPTIAEARDLILQTFKDAWDADPTSQNLEVRYDDRYGDSDINTNDSWARVTVKHDPIGFSPKALAGSIGQRRFPRNGTLTVQIFTPTDDGQETSDELTTIVLSAFEGFRNAGVWFRNIRFSEVNGDFGGGQKPLSDGWRQVNVRVEFEYATIN